MTQLIEFRARPLHEVKLAASGLFSGYASTWEGPPDAYGDTVRKGAFARSLAEWRAMGQLPAMLETHGMTDPLPAGRWLDMKEDDHGLAVTGQLSALNTDYGKRLHALLSDGSLNGLSIGFATRAAVPGDGKAGSPRRILTDVDLFEVSLVALPANRRALIDVESIKANGLPDKQSLEKLLRDAGLPNKAAKRITVGGWPALVGDRDDHDGTAAKLAASISEAAARLNRIVGNRNDAPPKRG